ncbi:hypothetical protein A2884_00260 [Candidatus Saccharibacteria bacterium RIFCSPHIGHO2_01_FULL_48_12]|nr:MAG: hypothetical protein A2884_00260 [Candidatus Saccharibacteria bacterium RIFCSPHIGHO2_01_FULL_48_12]OGL36800.1 MAG: hypothetical protein A3F38_02635 [Candidatus Saccharibacteria bacterium RIFCSPHIGHO2_12_FULL_48_21]
MNIDEREVCAWCWWLMVGDLTMWFGSHYFFYQNKNYCQSMTFGNFGTTKIWFFEIWSNKDR